MQSAGAAAVAAALLPPKEADAFFQDEAITPGKFDGFLSRAPVISIFDHRGCARKGVEYKGELSGGQDDEMLVKVAQTQLKIESPEFKELASSVLQAS